MLLENVSFFKDFLHRHTGDDDTSLTLDDPFDDVLDMVSLGRSDLAASCGTIDITGEEECILFEGFSGVIRTNCEDGWQRELQFFNCHRLQIKREIKW